MRRARTTDVFAMVDLLVEQQARSRYAGEVEVDEPYTRKLLAQAIQRNGGTTDGSSLVNVIEDDNGKIEAFMVGVLNSVYFIGNRLCAQDMFLVARPNASPLAAVRLIRAYIDWAEGNPKVYEIALSHTDALPEGNRMGPIYGRFGFRKSGAIFHKKSGKCHV